MPKTRPTRVLHARNVTNGELVQMVTRAAQLATGRLSWPRGLDRNQAPRLIHEYLRRRVRYYAEPPNMQVVRLPSATVKQRVADCKSTAVFLVAALTAAGIPMALRFIKQRGRPTWSHVYAVRRDTGETFDPLLKYGQEAVYSQRKDVPIR